MSASSVSIIVTRAEPGASVTAEHLRARGMTVILAPALTLDPDPDTPLPAPEMLSGLVFTSANGVRTYAARRNDRALTAWCVGPATAAAAALAGFSDIRESAGNAVDLANFIAAQSTPADQPLLHVANAAAIGGLKQTLMALGFSVIFAPLYQMRPAAALSAEMTELIAGGDTAILLIHSAKGAAAMAALLPEEPRPDWCLVAISDPASQPLVARVAHPPYIADAPNEDGLMRALDTALATLSA
ncbi:MAG: uroporphyrinogen-III synthase [Pseudomonadota bacterium]